MSIGTDTAPSLAAWLRQEVPPRDADYTETLSRIDPQLLSWLVQKIGRKFRPLWRDDLFALSRYDRVEQIDHAVFSVIADLRGEYLEKQRDGVSNIADIAQSIQKQVDILKCIWYNRPGEFALFYMEHLGLRDQQEIRTVIEVASPQTTTDAPRPEANGHGRIARRGHITLRSYAEVAPRVHPRTRRLIDVLQQPAPYTEGDKPGAAHTNTAGHDRQAGQTQPEDLPTPEERAEQFAKQGVVWHRVELPEGSLYTKANELAASTAVGMHRAGLYRALKNGEVRHHTLNGETVFTPEDVKDIVAYEQRLREAQGTPDQTTRRRRAGPKVGNRKAPIEAEQRQSAEQTKPHHR